MNHAYHVGGLEVTLELVHLFTREAVKRFSCPECGAAGTEPCLGRMKRDGSRRTRSAFHLARWELYREWRNQLGQPKH